MELPTYTSIWRIEKRLYKLYDFRLPMPVPVGQIAVFAAITVPYVVLLTVLGLPFNHTLFWLYVLPPGVLTWLATRPVLESKRLPELVISQVRYLGEPSTWCRMAPLAEKDEIAVVGRVWRREKDLDRSTSTEPEVEPQTAPARPRPAVAAQPARSATTARRSATPPAWATAASAAAARPAARTGRPAARSVPAKIRALRRLPGQRPGRLVRPYPRPWLSRFRRSLPGRRTTGSGGPAAGVLRSNAFPAGAARGEGTGRPRGRYRPLTCPLRPRSARGSLARRGPGPRPGYHPPPRAGPRLGYHPRRGRARC